VTVVRPVKVGSKAPAFRLKDETGAWVESTAFKGERVVLFFYPKASTPGCTVEACEFRDHMPRLEAAGVTVLGISPDGWRRQAKFKTAHGLPYRLLSDPEADACQAYGVWHQKLFWGRHYMGVIRSTFVVGADGRVEKLWRDVHHEGHAAAVSAWLRGEPEPAVVHPVSKKSGVKRPAAKKRATAEPPHRADSRVSR
jgi:peroxiredoxin Q/BCP